MYIWLLSGCTGSVMAPGASTDLSPEGKAAAAAAATANAAASVDMHPSDLSGMDIDIADAIKRISEEGPATYTARVHSCAKPKVSTLKNALAGLGVNVASTTANSAGQLLTTKVAVLGGPDYINRTGEATEPSTATSSSLFDILGVASTEVIANLTNSTNCAGTPAISNGQCNADGLTCILGVPASAAQVSICNDIIANEATKNAQLGQRLALSTVMAASLSCE